MSDCFGGCKNSSISSCFYNPTFQIPNCSKTVVVRFYVYVCTVAVFITQYQIVYSKTVVVRSMFALPYWRIIRRISLIGAYSLLSAYFAAVLNIPALKKRSLLGASHVYISFLWKYKRMRLITCQYGRS